ncbi:HDOD domain-containing protein [Chitinilyticum litopenaei]|uniref:HDOD domain-containing protein n=1 Tax=Chitinilyticum litopenaei TaxID=1121276 RepID=UPI000400A943|nr:HDOD domain-containing protein [Chitinilyticum litopenaei]
MTRTHLHLLWNRKGEWQALFALCPPDQQDWLAEHLQASPQLAALPCYVPGARAELGKLLPLQLRGQVWCADDISLRGGFTERSQLAQLAEGELIYGPAYLQAGSNQRNHPSQPALMQILALVVADADTRELEAAFAQAPSLTVRLLKLVNSVGIGSRVEITGIRHAITLLGRRQLQRWLQLLLYAEQFADDGEEQALMIGAALRAKRLENWAARNWVDHAPDSAFLVGMLSLLDRLFGQPLADLLADLPLQPALRAALLAGEGELGQALACAAALEAGTASPLPSASISPRAWLDSELDALDWACQLRKQHAPAE